VVQLCQISGHRELVRLFAVDHVLRIEQSWNSQLGFSHTEGVGVVLPDVGRFEDLVVKQVGPEVVNDGVEGQTIPEAVTQIVDVDIVILGGHLGAPYLQCS